MYKFEEGDRQLILLSLALCSVARPGFNTALKTIARALNGEQTFELFKLTIPQTEDPHDDLSPVHFVIDGQEVVYLQDSLSSWDGPLAYPSHVDKNGNMKLSALLKDSFAHVIDDGNIKRHGVTIGHIRDFITEIHPKEEK